jgi:regulator of cell morphogenesis and NO signaling
MTLQATPLAPVTSEALLGDLVAEVPSRAEVFDHVSMSYSVGGRRTLAQAASDHGLSVDELVRAIEAHDREGDLSPMDWSRVPPSRLVDQLDREHTTFMSELYLPAQGLLERVSLRDGQDHPELITLCDRVTAMEKMFVDHFDDETHGIFAECRSVDGDGDLEPTIEALNLAEITTAHIAIVEELDAVRAIIESIDLPSDPDDKASEDWYQFKLGYGSMERAMRRHMHCEEFILPRSVELAGS